MLYPFLIHYQYASCCSHGELEHAGTPQHHVTIQSAVTGVIGVGAGVLLAGKGIKESLHWKRNSFPPSPRFLFLPMPTEITARGFFSLPRPPGERNCIDLFYLLLPYASSYLSCKWKWDPKLQQMGPCHWMQMFSAPRPEYTCPIKLTLTPPPTEQTSLLQTRRSGNLFWVEARGTTVCPHVVNKKWWYQTPGPGRVQCYPCWRGSQRQAFPFPCTGSVWPPGQLPLFESLPLCWLFDGEHLLAGWFLGVEGWEAAVMEGWKKQRERGVEGEDCGRLTGASSTGLWERRSAGNVCKWEQALRAHIPSSSLSILLSFHSPLHLSNKKAL